MTVVTIFTPTFNRSHTLSRVYNSLLNQTSKNFEWLIVDDGSYDETSTLVSKWMSDNVIPIRYIKQQNLGMIGAHNTGLKNFSGDLFVCLDSDDYFTNNAIEIILKTWYIVKNNENCGGLVGLDISHSGEVIGDTFPDGIEWLTFLDIRFRYRIRGDKKYILSKEAINYAGYYPEVSGEKFPAASYLYRVIGKKFKFRVINIPLCVVEYLPDGNTLTKNNQYIKNPNAFMLFREYCINNSYNRKEKLISASHFVSSAFIAKKPHKILFNKNFMWTLLAIPFGIFIFLFIIIKDFLHKKR